jgi:hypothetical protein
LRLDDGFAVDGQLDEGAEQALGALDEPDGAVRLERQRDPPIFDDPRLRVRVIRIRLRLLESTREG